MSEACVICGSAYLLTFHHLIPRTCHNNKWFRKNFEKTDMKERGIAVCRKCHSFLHKQFSEKYLGRELNTLEKILENETIQNYARWARKRQRSPG